ncbi:MAG: hypothetical protein PHV34_11595 [Verrucomicrobiae bacterium]|nr:hypothetical protein [Verrucomicrobiae bacterium]
MDLAFSLDTFSAAGKKDVVDRLVRMGVNYLWQLEYLCAENLIRSTLTADFVQEGQWMRALALWKGVPSDVALNSCDQNLIRSSLADHFVQEGKWTRALALWKGAPTDVAFCCQKFSDRVQIHAAQGLKIIREGLAELARLESRGDPDFDLAQPGLSKGLIGDSRRELLSFRKALKRILPRKYWEKYRLDKEAQPSEPETLDSSLD